MPDKGSFWDFPAYSKIDELQDDRSDDYLIFPALKDELTQVERHDRHDYILYGDTEALLYRPKHLIPRIGMELYLVMLNIFRRNN